MVTRAVAAGLVWLVIGAGSASGEPSTIELPTPTAARVQQDQLIRAVGGLPDRLLSSDVPGAVTNDEVVRVGLRGDGTVGAVRVDQRLILSGTGDYAVRERGPARSATSLGSGPAPVTRRGAVVWQGFSPGRRDLAARLLLDPAIEEARLPLRVELGFTPAGGTERPLAPGGGIPGAGVVRVTITNATSQPQSLPTADDVDPQVIAPLLDRALGAARRPGPGHLPSTDEGLPATVRVDSPATSQSAQAVPYRVTGSLRLTETTGTFEGPGISPLRDGVAVEGTLGGSRAARAPATASFQASVSGPGALHLDLVAVAALNPQELAPPRGLASWAAWAAPSPPVAERRAALNLLVAVAATGARAASYSPYLGADLTGDGSTQFRFALEPAVPVPTARPAPHLRPGAVALASLAVLLIVVNGVLIWRRS